MSYPIKPFYNMKYLICFLATLFYFSTYAQEHSFFTISFEQESSEFIPKNEQDLEQWINLRFPSSQEIEILIHCLYQDDAYGKHYQLQQHRGQSIARIFEAWDIETQKIIFTSNGNDIPTYLKNIGTEQILVEWISSPLTPNRDVTYINTSPASPLEVEEKVIYTDQETTIHLEQGSIIDIPESAFQLTDGTIYEGRVIMEIEEIFNPASAYAKNFSTMSDQGILESRGMIEIHAKTFSGETLQLRNGKSLNINLPTKDYDLNDTEGFSIYNAVEKDVDGEIITEWELTPQRPNIVSRNTRDYTIFYWVKIPKNKKAEMELERKEIIEKMQSNRSKKVIKNRVKLYKSRIKRKNHRHKKKPMKRSYSGRNYSKIRKSDILGRANYYWEEMDESQYKFKGTRQFFSFEMIALGKLNLDRPLNIKIERIEEEILVKHTRNAKITIAFKGSFSMVHKKTKKNATATFRDIPDGEPIIIFSAQKTQNGQLYFSKLETISKTGGLDLPNPRIISQKEFEQFLTTLN